MKKKDAIIKFDELLTQYVIEKSYIKIERTFNNQEANIYGFILAFSKKFILFQKEEEIYLNGYAIFRKDQFEGIERDDFQVSIEKILTRENIIKNELGINFNIELKTWTSILLQLKERDIYIIAECEEMEESLLVLGRIDKVKVNSFSITGINEMGKFDESETVIKYKDLTLIKFGDRYIELFKKYIDS